MLEKTRIPPQRKGKRKASKFNTQAEICPFTSIFFCYSVNLWSWRDIVHYPYSFLSLPPSPSSLLFLFCLSYELSICGLVERAELFSPLSPILLVSLRKYAVKRADYWMALKLLSCLLISPSTLLSTFHSCFIFWPLSHTCLSSFII